MALVSSAYVGPLTLSLTNLVYPATTGVTTAPNWIVASANGAWAILQTALVDNITYTGSVTAANYQYVNGTFPSTEVATGHGYTLGGVDMHLTASGVGAVAPIGAFSVASTNPAVVKYTSAAGIYWTATDATGITANSIAFYVKNASGSLPMMFQLALGATYAATGNTATFTVTPAAGGWMTFSLG